MAAGLLAMHSPDETDAHGRHKRRMKRHKHGDGRRRLHRQRSTFRTPEPAAQTCDSKCGRATNNCSQDIDWGSCGCVVEPGAAL
jgi:hypothetical protein